MASQLLAAGCALPPAPDASFWSELQWKTLFAISDAIIPSVRTAPQSANDKVISKAEYDAAVSKLTSVITGPDARDLAIQYLEEDVSSNPVFRAIVERTVGHYIHDEGRNGLGLILNALNGVTDFDWLNYSAASATPCLPGESIPWMGFFSAAPLRGVYRGLTAIVKKSWVLASPTIEKVLGFPRVPVHGKPTDGFSYEFLQIPPGEGPEIIETDVVIVGSGCGGAVTAKNLAEAGLRVLVVEKSYCYTSKSFPMAPNEAYVSMFENSGAVVSDDGAMVVIGGSTWGGGGTVNWSAALQTQAYVRQEWADGGLPLFTSWDYQRSLDRVCERMGVNTEHVKHNRQNNVILEGARKLGYAASTVPQNTGNAPHYCGHCTMGCAAAGKKGPTETFLADASNAGATFIEGLRVDRVIFGNKKGGKQVATGVEGTWTSRDQYLGLGNSGTTKRKVIIKAKKVVVSSGTLNSPLLLLRSGIKNSQIGRNLHLHPVMGAAAVFDEDTHPWEGSSLTTVVTEFEDMDGHGHGVKLESASMIPSIFIPVFPWEGGLEYKLASANFRRSTSFITLTKDRDGGRVYPDPTDGRVRIEYQVSAFDRRHIVEGLIAAAKIAYISGAKEFVTTYRDIPPFVRDDSSDADSPEGTNNAALQNWIAELRRKSPLDVEKAMFASAHQMGTCRMGKSAKTSVVDSNCQVWGTDGLYVVDASVFPSASGVNPMVTNMAIADWASQNLAQAMNQPLGENTRMARL
ncbi:hypothetical protein N7454_007981 [Penicillium verhagenii]|nr:hypothetical protein N7454_007981 [Penicillium verhagenii]